MHFPSTKGIAARAATAALGFALVLSQVPAAALAEAAGTAGAQATAQQISAEAAPDAATTQGEPAAAPAPEGEAPSAAGSTSATPAAPDAATASAVASVAAATAATPAAATSSAKAAPAVATVAPEVARIVSASGSQVRYDTVVAPGAKLTVNAYTTEEDDWGDEDEAPVDTSAYAGYAFQWYRGTVVSYSTKFDSYTPIAGATSRSYTVVDADADSYLACKISFTRADGSHGELWSDSSTGKVADGRATLDSAKVAGTAKEGQTLLASAYVANGWGGTTEADLSSSVAWQWQQASASDGTYVDIAGATKSTFTLTDALVGRFLRVRASSRNNVTSAAVGPVVARGTQQDEELLAQAVKALESDGFSGYAPSPVYGTDANVNDMVHARLVSLGEKYADVQVATQSVETTATSDPSQRGGISCDAADNGKVTFFSLSPQKKTVSTSMSVLRQVKPTFRLKYGTATAWYTPAKYVQLDWDQKAMSAELDAAADSLAPAYATGDSADSVTQKFTLPNKAGTGVSVSWKSSDDSALGLSGYSWDDQTTATPSQGTQDRHVTLTATVSFSGSDAPSGSVTRTFDVTVKGDPSLVQRQLAEAQQKLDDNFTYKNLKYISSADGDLDPVAVTGDIQLPTTKTLGTRWLDFDVTVSYSASNQTLQINGYRANVLRPVEGASDAAVEVTCKVALKDDPTQYVTKTLELAVKPLQSGAIDVELALLHRVSDQFGARLLDGQDAAAVTRDLKPFMEAYQDASGTLSWAEGVAEADAAHGIVAAELAGYDPMGPSDQGRTFASSDSAVVSNQTLRVTRPQYNTRVQITANLASEKYGAYYARYKDDAGVSAELKVKLSELAGTQATASLTVSGTTGKDAPYVQATASVIGVDAFGKTETWATSMQRLDSGSTAWDLTRATLAASGITYAAQDTSYGTYLQTVTSPTTGVALGSDAGTGRYWQLFVNGKPSDAMADSVKITDGDSVVWYYSAYGDQLPASDAANVTASVKVVGPNAAGQSTSWVGQSEASVPAGTTAAQLTKTVLERNGMTCDDMVGTISAASGVLPNGQASLGYAQVAAGNRSWWQFYVNGKLSNDYAAQYVVRPGDRIEWFFGSYGEEPPAQDVTVMPDAPRPDFAAEWGAYKGTDGTGTSAADTPTNGSRLAWACDLGTAGQTFMSDPILVNGQVYVAVRNKLQVRDAKTGRLLQEADLADRVESTCRIAYANGVVVVPLRAGRVQALTADSLKTVWLTDALPAVSGAAQQPISTPLVRDGYVYLGTAAAGYDGTSLGGTLLALNLKDGSVRWQHQEEGSGYYWAGAAQTVAGILVADDGGNLTLHDASTGKVRATFSLGAPSRAGIVAAGGGTVAYVVTTDGVLHRMAIASDGALSQTGTVQFDNASTSTPTLCNGKIYVGGADRRAAGTGSISVIDAQSLKVECHVTTTSATKSNAIPGDVKSAPLVVTKSDGTYVYFTSNGRPGGVFMYKVGAKHVTLLYVPDQAQRQYNMASVVAAADGSLYFVNDSGFLFKLAGASTADVLPSQEIPRQSGTEDSGKDTGKDAGKDSGKDTGKNAGKNAGSQGEKGKGPGSAHAAGAGNVAAGGKGGNGNTGAKSGAAKPGSTKLVHGTASPAGGKASGTAAASGPLTLLNDVASDVLGIQVQDGATDGTSEGTASTGDASADAPAKTTASKASAAASRGRTLPIWPVIGMTLGAVVLIMALLRRGKRDVQGTK
jgi:hypothetical protein